MTARRVKRSIHLHAVAWVLLALLCACERAPAAMRDAAVEMCRAGAEAPAGMDDAGAPDARAVPRGVAYPGQPSELPDKVAYLTFDDGPSEWTHEVLDTLRGAGVGATFFVTARQLKGAMGLQAHYTDDAGAMIGFGDVLAHIVREGHVLGNHTVDHRDLATLDDASATCQLDLNERLINAALRAADLPAMPLTLLRPPFGSPWRHTSAADDRPAQEARVSALLAPRGVNVLWTVDSGDSRDWAQDESYTRVAGKQPPSAAAPSYAQKVERVVRAVLDDPNIARGAGAVVLLHDTHNATRDALPALIAGLRERGYRFERIEHHVQARWGAPSGELLAREPLLPNGSDCTALAETGRADADADPDRGCRH